MGDVEKMDVDEDIKPELESMDTAPHGSEAGESATCHCRKPRSILHGEVFCSECKKFFHIECLEGGVRYKLKFAYFSSSYHFICASCSPNNADYGERKRTGILDYVTTAVAQLTANRALDDFRSKILSRMVIPEPGTIFFTAYQVASYLEENWQRVTAGAMPRKSYEDLSMAIENCCKRNTNVFTANANFGSRFALNIPLANIGRHCPLVKQEILASPISQSESSSSRPVRRAAAQKRKEPAGTLPPTTESFSYYRAEADPFADKVLDEACNNITNRIPLKSLRFRRVVPTKVTLSPNDKSEKLKLSNDELGVLGFEGYRMVRATHAVSRGKWYYEATILAAPKDTCVRIGWSQEYATLEATLGYGKLSYGLRSEKGTKFHNSRGYKYYAPGFRVNDVIGMLISLPEQYDQEAEYGTQLRERHMTPTKKYTAIDGAKANQRHFKEEKPSRAVVEKDLKILEGSTIDFFVNGQPCATEVAYTNIYQGAYYPTVALYGYGSPPEVRVSFAPEDLKFLPEGCRPVSERVDEMAVELTLGDMLDLIVAKEEIRKDVEETMKRNKELAEAGDVKPPKEAPAKGVKRPARRRSVRR